MPHAIGAPYALWQRLLERVRQLPCLACVACQSISASAAGAHAQARAVPIVIYSRVMTEDDLAFVGGEADDPAFAVMADALEAPAGEPVETYARPLSAEQVGEFQDQLDAVEPAHASAAARLHTLFAG
jgi:hypothetical protein